MRNAHGTTGGALDVKRDMDTVRELLMRIELGEDDILAERGSAEEHHLLLLKDARFIDSQIDEFPMTMDGDRTLWMRLMLTWAGCEYLDSVRDEGKWEKVKRLIASKGESASVETVKAAVALLVRQAFGN